MADLPVSQNYALLYLRRGGTDSLYNKITDAMRTMGISFAKSDFDQLAALGYVRRDGRGHHALTPNGLWKAQTLAREMAKRYQIHHVTFRDPGEESTLGPSVTCSCGWGTTANKRNENAVHRYAQQHLAQVACGSWKPPRTVYEIFADFFLNPKSDSASAIVVPQVVHAAPERPGAVVPSVAATAPGMEGA